MKELFCIENYPGKVVMHCETKEEAEVFCGFLDKQGRSWINSKRDGFGYADRNYFEEYGENTCYNFNKGTYGDISYYRRYGYRILSCKDFAFYEEEYDIESDEFTKFIDEFSVGCGG